MHLDRPISRRVWLQLLGAGALAQAVGGRSSVAAAQAPMPAFTGPAANPFWNAVGPFATYPQKLPLILLTDRPVQLETPRAYFASPITSNAAFYVRWHLDGHPHRVDLGKFALTLEGAVRRPCSFTYEDLLRRFTSRDVVAVNQCSGNSRSIILPRVPGSQWGHGAMGCAKWTGVPLRALLEACEPTSGAMQIQFEGMEQGPGQPGHGAYRFAKSLSYPDPVMDDILVAYAMNDAPLPLLNGFPLRLVVPGFFATYWVKALAHIRLLTQPDANYWTAKAYRIPDTPRGHITPAQAKDPAIKKVPLGRMPVRSLIIGPDDCDALVADLPTVVHGVAFSGMGDIDRVEVSSDAGNSWSQAALAESLGRYAFRMWRWPWVPAQPGTYKLQVRARDTRGNIQTSAPFWNPSGYGFSGIVTQQVQVGRAR